MSQRLPLNRPPATDPIPGQSPGAHVAVDWVTLLGHARKVTRSVFDVIKGLRTSQMLKLPAASCRESSILKVVLLF
jgi:hypothetical protein